MKHKTEFDDRPLPHTTAMKEPENRFNDARRRYEGTMGAAVVSHATVPYIWYASFYNGPVLNGGSQEFGGGIKGPFFSSYG